jgi:triosephosphate isomerase (TIM)
MRTKIVAGNWKMNLLFDEAEELMDKLISFSESESISDVQIILCPPFPYLELGVELTHETGILIGAQNVHSHNKGAYTGEVSAPMLQSLNVDCCIIGHSERRRYFAEGNEILLLKLKAVLAHEMAPIFCFGEMLEDREADKHFDLVKQQLEDTVFTLDKADFSRIILAYEPVWAIGTGLNATPEQAQEMHAYIRKLIQNRYDLSMANESSILYGGSCNAKNAADIFKMPDVDGGLIGGASLVYEDFTQIINALNGK